MIKEDLSLTIGASIDSRLKMKPTPPLMANFLLPCLSDVPLSLGTQCVVFKAMPKRLTTLRPLLNTNKIKTT